MLATILKEGQQTMNTPQNNQGDLKGILKEIVLRKIRNLHRSAERTGGNFNIFSILDRERKEVTTHSAVIAELLNPHGSHGQETSFLKLFLDQLLKKLHEEQKPQEKLEELRKKLKHIQEDEFDKFRVEVEASKKDKEGEALGRIDILIESHGIESGDVCIVIENKIDAEDQERQLGRYYDYASGTGKKHCIIYLTLGGSGPKEFTLYGDKPSRSKIKDTVVCLSYGEFIYKWLDTCIKKVAHIPQIKETLHQYQMTVKKLTEKPTGQLPPEVEDILKRTGGKDDIIKDVQHELQCEFWKEFKKRLVEEQLTDQNSKFQLYESGLKHKEIPDVELENICHPSLGLTFGIPEGLLDDGEHEVAFRVFYERAQVHSYFTYGFVFRRKDTLRRVKIEKHKQALVQYTRLGHQNKEEKDDGWISWTYFPYPPRNFITESKETLIRRLITEINLALSKAR